MSFFDKMKKKRGVVQTPAERIIATKMDLATRHPFFYHLLLYLDAVPSDKHATMATDDRKVYYNPKFLEELTADELKFVLCHEILHVAFQHSRRRGNRDPRLWNIATDFAINDILVRAGVGKMPSSGGLYDPQYEGMSADEIYEILKQQKIIDCGYPGPLDELLDPQDQREAEGRGAGGEGGEEGEGEQRGGTRPVDWDRILIRAATHARMQGRLPAHVSDLIDDIYKAKVTWKDRLRNYIDKGYPADYDWTRPSRRSLSGVYGKDVYYPSLTGEELEIVTVLDTSGSISDDELRQFLGEVAAIKEEFNFSRVHVIMADVAVADYFLIEDYQAFPSRVKVSGRGGTDFRPAFKYIKDVLINQKFANPRLVIYFTDGYGDFPDPNEYFPFDVLWVITTDVKPPFGDVIYVNE